jgi:hypothetical protein
MTARRRGIQAAAKIEENGEKRADRAKLLPERLESANF